MNVTDISHQDAHPPLQTPPERIHRNRAWVAVVLIPVFFIVAFAVTYGLYVLLGFQPEDSDIPLRVDLLAGIPGIVLFLIPCVAAVLFGGRATRAGDRWGLIPATVGALAGLWFTIMSLVTIFAG